MIKTSRKSNALDRLQDWYLHECNGDWEHQFGVKIDTLDNPGWNIEVDIRDTYLAERKFSKVSVQRKEENDWLIYSVQDQKFIGSCGPKNLEELISLFLDWADETK